MVRWRPLKPSRSVRWAPTRARQGQTRRGVPASSRSTRTRTPRPHIASSPKGETERLNDAPTRGNEKSHVSVVQAAAIQRGVHSDRVPSVQGIAACNGQQHPLTTERLCQSWPWNEAHTV